MRTHSQLSRYGFENHRGLPGYVAKHRAPGVRCRATIERYPGHLEPTAVRQSVAVSAFPAPDRARHSHRNASNRRASATGVRTSVRCSRDSGRSTLHRRARTRGYHPVPRALPIQTAWCDPVQKLSPRVAAQPWSAERFAAPFCHWDPHDGCRTGAYHASLAFRFSLPQAAHAFFVKLYLFRQSSDRFCESTDHGICRKHQV